MAPDGNLRCRRCRIRSRLPRHTNHPRHPGGVPIKRAVSNFSYLSTIGARSRKRRHKIVLTMQVSGATCSRKAYSDLTCRDASAHFL